MYKNYQGILVNLCALGDVCGLPYKEDYEIKGHRIGALGHKR